MLCLDLVDHPFIVAGVLALAAALTWVVPHLRYQPQCEVLTD